MARSGIYKSEVARARTNLMAQGRYPSVDALRIELGNTGSKGTIQKYLKEIEEEETNRGVGRGVVLSDAIKNLATKLAEQLQDEADEQLLVTKAAHVDELKAVQDLLHAAQAKIKSQEGELAAAGKAAAAEADRYSELHATFIAETQARHAADQRASDLQLQLESEIRHREGAEAKYADARQSLEHFREASREQRDQEARQHENQVQFLQKENHGLKESLTQAQLKSTEAFRELASLTSELGSARRELGQMDKLKGQVQSLTEKLGAVQSQRDSLNGQFEQEKKRSETLQTSLIGEVDQRKAVEKRNQELESELLTMRVQVETSEKVTEQIRLQVSQVLKAASEQPITR